jgi:hypothetical protein
MLVQGYYSYSLAGSDVFQQDAFQFDDPSTPGVNEAAFQEKIKFGTRTGVFISLGRVAKNKLDAGNIEVMNIITDIFNGEVMVLRANEDPSAPPQIFHADVRKKDNYPKYIWRSKMFATPYVMNLGAAKVYWTAPYTSTTGFTAFRVYAGSTPQEIEDGLPLKFEQNLGQSGQMFRLPSGYKALYWQFEVEGVAIIDSIHVAQSARDLRAI